MFKNKSNKLISIIVNCHNGEKYLKECIKSVLDQTFTNWELIFYDNFSIDNSLSIINSYNDKRLKIYSSKKFLNLYEARNEAVKKTTGDYICFLDTDDYWEKGKIEEQLLFMENNSKYIMVYSNYYVFDQQKNQKYLIFNSSLPQGAITKKIIRRYPIGILTVLIKKEVFNNISFNPVLNILGDFDFFIKLSLKYNIGSIQKPLATYRVHSNNYSKKKYKEYITELKNWIRDHEAFFKKLKISLINQKILLFKLKIKNFLKFK